MLPPKPLWRVKMLNNSKPAGKFTKKPVVVQNNTKYRPGDVVTLKVVRLGEMGAFLDLRCLLQLMQQNIIVRITSATI